MKELSTASVVGSVPSSLVTLRDRLSIIHDDDLLVFLRSPLLGDEEVAFYYPIRRLVLARCDSLPMTPNTFGPLLKTAQIIRNTTRYGFWDGMAATNLQDSRPAEHATVLKLGFFVRGAEYQGQLLVLSESHGNDLPLRDTAAYLQSLALSNQ